MTLRLFRIFITATTLSMVFSACDSDEQTTTETNMCEKLPMQPDGIVRLSKIQVNPDHLDEYMKYAVEVGTVSLETEPGC